MPVEVREIVVRMLVEESAGVEVQEPVETSSVEVEDRMELITECVEQVLQILEDKKEP